MLIRIRRAINYESKKILFKKTNPFITKNGIQSIHFQKLNNKLDTSIVQLRHFSSNIKDVKVIKSSNQNQMIRLNYTNGKNVEFDSLFLRANCSCDTCEHKTGQRLYNASDIPKNLKVNKIKMIKNDIQIIWFPDNHTSSFEIKWLEDITNRNNRIKHTNIQLENAPTMDYSEFGQILSPKKEKLLFLLDTILKNGLCIIKNVPIEKKYVKKFAEMISPISHSYLYGDVFDVISEHNPINIAYTNEYLKFHMDLAYYESPPGLQLLHTIEFNKNIKGGESIFLDGIIAANILKETCFESFEILTKYPATFKKFHLKRTPSAIMEYHRPHILVNPNNINDILSIFWSPPFEGIPIKIPQKNIHKYYKAYQLFDDIINGKNGFHDYTIKFRLEAGDLVIFNQRRMLHGRNAFSTSSEGKRHLQGTYLNMDEILCHYNVLQYEINGSNHIKNQPILSNGSLS